MRMSCCSGNGNEFEQVHSLMIIPRKVRVMVNESTAAWCSKVNRASTQTCHGDRRLLLRLQDPVVSAHALSATFTLVRCHMGLSEASTSPAQDGNGFLAPDARSRSNIALADIRLALFVQTNFFELKEETCEKRSYQCLHRYPG